MKHKELLNQAPFLRLILPLMTGIGVRLHWALPPMLTFYILIITLLVAFCFTVFKDLSINYGLRWISGVTISVAIFCLGIILTGKKLENTPNALINCGLPMEMIGIISEPTQEKAKSVQCFLKLDQLKQNTKYSICNDKILLYLQKDSASLALKAGDLIIAKFHVNTIRNTGNPYEFDYRRYLSLQGIHFSGYADRQSWRRLSANNLSSLQMLAYHIREKLLAIFTRIGLNGKELGVASALIIGDTSNLDSEIKQAYVASGTMHILAVSGMHIALLYWVLNMLLSFLDRIKHGRYFKIALLLLAIWFYALITGLGGSILRASVMITFVVIGQSFNRNISVFNSLAASAFLLLLINPFNLIDVGFQLSYFAVLSIVIFHPLIYKLIDVKNWFGDQLWLLTSVTLSAQIVTTPISLYYFHQFPNLFIISNLVMIPLSTLIMYFAMVLIPISGWTWLAAIMGKVFYFLVWLLNKIVLTIEGLPFALTKGIYINWLDVCFLYILICFATLFFIKRRSVYLVLGLSVSLVLIAHSLISKYQQFTNKEIIFYNDNKNPVIQFYSRNKSIWLVGQKNERVDKYINLAKYAMQSKENQVYLLDSIQQRTKNHGLLIGDNLWVQGSFIQFFHKKIVIPNGIEIAKSIPVPINFDYLVVNDIKACYPRSVGNGLSAKLAIIAPNITGYKAKQMEKLFADKKIATCNIQNSGALRIKVCN